MGRRDRRRRKEKRAQKEEKVPSRRERKAARKLARVAAKEYRGRRKRNRGVSFDWDSWNRAQKTGLQASDLEEVTIIYLEEEFTLEEINLEPKVA